MKRTKMTFLLSEIFLFIMLLLCVHRIFSDEKPQKRVAVIVEKSGDKIYVDKLSKKIGCEVVEISALKGTGIQKAAEKEREGNLNCLPLILKPRFKNSLQVLSQTQADSR